MDIRHLFGKRVRDIGKDAQTISHKYLLKGGYARQLASGIYSLLPLGKRIISKIESIIRTEMNALGASEVLLPVVMPRNIWDESGRYQDIGKEMVRFKDRNDHDLLLGMTHEEAIVALARTEVTSYKDYPFCLYQIQTKFRDEPRPRAGLLRVREFSMKDAYSFHRTHEDLKQYYELCYKSYERIFSKCGVRDLAIVESDPGMMGGMTAHEFMLVCDAGEDTLVICPNCNYSANLEIARSQGTGEVKAGDFCIRCSNPLTLRRGVELGNIFQLGDKYTRSMRMSYMDEHGKTQHPLMGCYGIGVGRLMASLIEQSHDKNGPIWPSSVAPLDVHIVVLNPKIAELKEAAHRFYKELAGFLEPLIDSRNESPGQKFVDADLIGIPIRVVISKTFLDEGVVEVVEKTSGNVSRVSITEAVHRVRSLARQ